MNPDAVAIRLPALGEGPRELIGKHPVVVFAEQGLAPAGLDEGSKEAELPAFRQETGKFQLDSLVVVLDRSTSMTTPVEPGSSESKMDHIKRQMSRLGQDFFPECHMALVTLSADAERIAIADGMGMRGLQKAIEDVRNKRGTNFERALSLAAEEVEQTISRTPDGRNAVVFITDGFDMGSRERAQALAEAIRGFNTGTFLIGVGAHYDLRNLFELSSRFGFSGWAHTPTPGAGNVFGLLLPSMLNDLQTAEHYLQIRASGPVAKFYGITPAVREAADGVFYVGYQNQGVGICFTESDQAKLTLEVKKHIADPDGSSTEIQILDVRDAAAHFERLDVAQRSVGPLLVMLAQLNSDAPLLGRLQFVYPSLAPLIRPLLDELGVGESADAVTRLNARAGMSDLGSLIGTEVFTRVNELSRIERRPIQTSPPPPPSPEQAHLHSGALGPLSMPPRTIGSLGEVNPDAYRDVKPLLGAKLVLALPDGSRKFPLESIVPGSGVTAGRSPDCQIVLGADMVSRRHFEIRRGEDGFWLNDLGSRNGTYLNGAKLDGKHRLEDGDSIRAGSIELRFRAG